MNIASARFFTIASTEPRNARNCPRSVPVMNLWKLSLQQQLLRLQQVEKNVCTSNILKC